MLISGNTTAIVPNMFQRVLNFQYSSGIDLLLAKLHARRACLIWVGIKTVIQIIPDAMNSERPHVNY